MTSLNPTMLVFDSSNILYRTFFANPDTKDDILTAGLAHHHAFTSLNYYFKKYNPEKVVMVFDRPSWRVPYSQSEVCISGRVYKGHRRQNMTQGERDRYERFKQHLAEFEQIVTHNTSIVCMARELLEADDIMAGLAHKYNDTHNMIFISSDKDLMQLLRYPSVYLVDPATDKRRTLEEYENNADLFIYEKCFRGDAGDNVQSAYPRLRATKIRKAFDDAFEHESLMNTTWTDQDGKVMKVRELFEENKMLMDLSNQPEYIQEDILRTIELGFQNPGEYNHFEFLKFCGKYKLKRVSEHLERYIPMLSI